VVGTRHNQAEPNLKDYGKKCPVAAAGRLSWVTATGITHADRITARPNMGESPLDSFRDNMVRYQVLWSKSGLGPALGSRLESESKLEPKQEEKPRYGLEFESKPFSHLGYSRAPLVGYWG